MIRIKLAAAGALGLAGLVAASAVIARQDRAGPAQTVPVRYVQAPAFTHAADEQTYSHPRRSLRLLVSEPEDDRRAFEDYARDEDGILGQSERDGDDDDWRGRRGGRWDDEGPRGDRRGPPRGMTGPRAFGPWCGPRAGRRAEMLLSRLERIVNPTEAQRAAFDKLRDAGARAHEIVRASCPTERPMTPTGRLALAEKRLEAMLQAVRTLRPAMEEFFATLSEEQKARLYAYAPRPYGHWRGGPWRPGGAWGGPEGWRERWRERRREREGRRDRDDDDDRSEPWRGRL